MERVEQGMRTVTELLRDWRAGDQRAADQLLPLVYDELRALAAGYMQRERRGHTLRPTDLIGEAYVRLAAGSQPTWDDRSHFFAIAARTMRQVLVDHARKHGAQKRGAGEQAVTFDDDIAVDRPAELLALDEALDELTALDHRKARAVELHYFGGLTHEEVARELGVHVNTVSRELKLAEAWIHRRMSV